MLTVLIKRRMAQGKLTVITNQYSMTDALAGIAKKQDAEATFKRIHEKGSIHVFESRREDLVA